MKPDKEDDWDDEEEPTKPGPDPERLNIEGFTPEEVARRIMAAGRPQGREEVEAALEDNEEDEEC